MSEPYKLIYGLCPICGANGIMRERRPNGNDRCSAGHVYASSRAVGVGRKEPAPNCDTCRTTCDPDPARLQPEYGVDGSALIPDELVEGYINQLHWSKHATETEVTLVVCNLRSFANWLRTHMHTPNEAPATTANLQSSIDSEGP
jgi:hypothetical protein